MRISVKTSICFILYFFLVVGSFLPLRAQTYSFYDYTVQDGLAQSNVAAVIQDAQGYIWLGTESGLSRYDGKNIQNYTTEDGLGDNNISAMLLDKDTNIWIGHANGSITRYNGKTFEIIHSKGLPQNRKIYSIYQDLSGKIWISAAAYGVIAISNPLGDLTKEENYRSYKAKDGLSEYVSSIYQTSDSTLWFLTDIGIKYYIPRENKFDFLRIPGLPALQKTCILEDKKGNIWLGTYSNANALVIKVNRKTNSFVTYNTQAGISALKEDKDGNLWVATWGSGIYVIGENGIQKHFNTDNGLSVNKIYSICEDREGNMILGTFGSGFTIFKGDRFVHYTTSNGLISNQVWAIAEDNKNNLWFGTNAGVSVYNVAQNKFTNFDQLANEIVNKDVRDIKKDNNGNIWIVCGGKLLKYNDAHSKFDLIPKIEASVTARIVAVEIDQNDNLWIGTSDGILIYNISKGEIEKSLRTTDGLASNDISNIYEDSKKNIWICTKGGLTLYKNSKCKKYSKEDGFSSNNPIAVEEDKTGTIWVGTEGKGLYRYDGKRFINVKFNENLISERIALIEADEKNNLWIGTNKGLNKINKSKNEVIHYGKLDGFKSLETLPNSVYRDKKDNIWFGTVDGVVRFNPDYDNYNNLEPLTSITSIKISGKELDQRNAKAQLTYKENSLTFEYIGICISNPEKVKYQAMLEGLDEDWRSETKQTSYEYANLSPGDYVFKVKACNNNGVWNKIPVSFAFEITPPWYKTRLFYFFMIVTLIISIGGYIKIREKSLLREKKILEAKVAQRTAEVVKKSDELDEKNKEIMASIRYAKRIQDAILPPTDYVRTCLPQTFILYKPKDIVSGDFYWIFEKKDKVLFAAVDCTGHGVPGAFMSIVGHNLLEQIVSIQELVEPAAILDALNKSVSDTLRQSKVDESVKDGMDMTLCCLDKKTNELQFAGAFNPLYMIHEGELTEIKGDKFPIGNLKIGEDKRFTNHKIQLKKGDAVYIFTDGYADQFGGPKGKKFLYKAFKELLVSIQNITMEEQKSALDKALEDWKGSTEQVDDILVIGTKL